MKIVRISNRMNVRYHRRILNICVVRLRRKTRKEKERWKNVQELDKWISNLLPPLLDRRQHFTIFEAARIHPPSFSISDNPISSGVLLFFSFFFLHLGETLSRMGSSTIFQRSYSKTRTFSNFRSSRFIPHPPSLLLVLAIEIKSASITTVPLLKNDEVTLLFFLFFFCFLFFVFCFFSIPPHNKSASGIFIGTAFETVTRFRDWLL